MSIRDRILWKLTRLRLQPIRVFCFHHVSDERDSLVCIEEDWTQTDQFKRLIMKLQEEHTFISLKEAIEKLKHDRFRVKKYAVLTCDDGLKTIPFLWPWLEKQNVPLTCFINAKYLDGKSFKELDEIRVRRINNEVSMLEVAQRQYMSWKDFDDLSSPLLTWGFHGSEHIDITTYGERECCSFVQQSIQELSGIDNVVPFWAYTWGRHNAMTDCVLKEKGIIPVYMDGQKNYNDASCIHRELLDNYKVEKKNNNNYICTVL